MKKRLILLLFWLMPSSILFAQDVIVKRNGKKIESRVIEVSSTEIKYKKSDNPDGPLYVISKSDVLLIQYANGVNEMISYKAPKEMSPQTKLIEIRGPRYYQNGIRLDDRAIVGILGANHDTLALNEMKAGIVTRKWGSSLIFVGLPSIGGGLGTFMGSYQDAVYASRSGSPDNGARQQAMVGAAIAFAGMACIISGITIKMEGVARIRRAVDLYNSRLKPIE